MLIRQHQQPHQHQQEQQLILLRRRRRQQKRYMGALSWMASCPCFLLIILIAHVSTAFVYPLQHRQYCTSIHHTSVLSKINYHHQHPNDHHHHHDGRRQNQLMFFRRNSISAATVIVVKGSMKDRDEDALSRAENDSRTDVRNLLTQRAIQSFMFLCVKLRDPHTVEWIENFLQTRNQLEFHGTGAGYLERMGGTWDAPLLQMMQRDKDVVTVSVKRTGKGHRGWSKNNPFLEERFVEFRIDIDPVSLASRILSVREQIAKEWEADLDVLGTANDRILDSYFAIAREEQKKKDDELTTTPNAFERTALNILANHTAFTSQANSPFRKGNFDLLYNLCTQSSIHRVLRQLRQDGETKNEISFAWLRDFYVGRVEEYFDGDQPYGRADDFLEDLLLSPPSVIYQDDGTVGFADPMSLAEQIIETRSIVVEEWKELMRNVPQDHSDGLRQTLLTRQMQSWGANTPLDGSTATGTFE